MTKEQVARGALNTRIPKSTGMSFKKAKQFFANQARALENKIADAKINLDAAVALGYGDDVGPAHARLKSMEREMTKCINAAHELGKAR